VQPVRGQARRCTHDGYTSLSWRALSLRARRAGAWTDQTGCGSPGPCRSGEPLRHAGPRGCRRFCDRSSSPANQRRRRSSRSSAARCSIAACRLRSLRNSRMWASSSLAVGKNSSSDISSAAHCRRSVASFRSLRLSSPPPVHGASSRRMLWRSSSLASTASVMYSLVYLVSASPEPAASALSLAGTCVDVVPAVPLVVDAQPGSAHAAVRQCPATPENPGQQVARLAMVRTQDDSHRAVTADAATFPRLDDGVGGLPLLGTDDGLPLPHDPMALL
jgi:hypothetical protein